MTQRKRQLAIVNRVDAVGACSYQELAKLLGVSEMTIRRDVDKLVERGELIKALGGAQTAHAPKHLFESAVQQRLNVQRGEKEQIASAGPGADHDLSRRCLSTAARRAWCWPASWPGSCTA